MERDLSRVDDNEDKGSGGDDEDTGSVMPWLICFLVCLVVAWLIWFFRRRLLQLFWGNKDPPARAISYAVPMHPQPGMCDVPSSAVVCVPPKATTTAEQVHWHWVSTGKPPRPSPELRVRSKTIVSSNFRARLVSRRSDMAKSRISGSASIDSIKFSIGGYDTPSYCSNLHSLSLPSQSLQSQKSCPRNISNHKFKLLLSRICGITDPDVKKEIFDLTFEIIQLGDWNDQDWKQFIQNLFNDKIGGDKFVVDLQNDLKSKEKIFSDIARTMLQSWVTVNGIEKADVRKLYEALEHCDKQDLAHNAAINVVLVLRHKQGRTTSDCTDPFSEQEETPTTSLDYHSLPKSEPFPERRDSGEKAVSTRNGQKDNSVNQTQHRLRLISMNSGNPYPSLTDANLSL